MCFGHDLCVCIDFPDAGLDGGVDAGTDAG
jgi:hypothetical protein